MTKKIETKEELVNWAKRANLCSGQSGHIANLQDEFARSDVETLRQVWNSLGKFDDTDRRLVTFSISKVMGTEAMYQWVRLYARTFIDSCIMEEMELVNDKHAKVMEQEEEHQNTKFRLAQLEADYQRAKDTEKSLRADIRMLEPKAQAFMNIKRELLTE